MKRIFQKIKKLHTPNPNFYEQHCINQAKQKGGNLPAFHGAQLQQGYGLGNVSRGLFRWAVPHLQQGAWQKSSTNRCKRSTRCASR